jgi:hypothetical protein
VINHPPPTEVQSSTPIHAVEGTTFMFALPTFHRTLISPVLVTGLLVLAGAGASVGRAAEIQGKRQENAHQRHGNDLRHGRPGKRYRRLSPRVVDGELQLFAPTSVWNQPLSPTAAIDPTSAALVSGLASQAATEYQQGIGPDLGTTGTTTFYEVGPNQPSVTVQLSNPTAWWRVSLQQAFNAVPIPANAQPANGADAEMTIWQPSTDKLWEFFQMHKTASGWNAAWGGAMNNVSQSPGYYSPSSWPGALSVWGATATSLPPAAGVITLQDVQQGRIDHALALELPYPRARVWAWPAQRSDGTGTDPNAIPEGAELRLDPNLNLAALHLPPLTLMIAQAAQTYGLIVTDQTHYAIGLFAENPISSGTNPYYTSSGTPSPTGPFGGQWPDSLLHSFPWSSLEVLKMNLHS